MSDVQYLTQEKYDALEKELKELKEVKLHATAKRIDEAREMGDLSENAEYHAAREELAWQQSRVREIESILDHAQVVAQGGKSGGSVQIGSIVIVKVNGNEREYVIVGAQEADPLAGKISNESPLGQAFLGKKKGDEVEVQVPAGVQVYVIVDIK